MERKKLLAIMAMAFILILAACGGGNSNESEESSSESANENSGEKIHIRFSHNQPTDSPEHTGAKSLKKLLKKNRMVKWKWKFSQLDNLVV